MPASNVRTPSHAGSWYEDNERTLAKQIDEWMGAVQNSSSGQAQAIIGPHAGYRFCGHVLAHAYKHIDPRKVSRVFLLGPSHHVYTKRCVLSTAAEYATPLGSIPIDQDVYSKLKATGAFELMDLHEDEEEHSLELHTPYIVRMMRGKPFTLVPIMVGSLSTASEAMYGEMLAPYLNDPSNCFVISSDFCHWGARFSYTFYDKSQGPIWKSIQWLDEQGMKAIETGQPKPFTEYLQQYRNTICGRHAIGILLNMLQHCKPKFRIQFQHYDQSSRCQAPTDSSVSYAAATVTAI